MKKLVFNDSIMDKIFNLAETFELSNLLILKMLERRLYLKFNDLE